ncbi:hypothetical protein Pedsa_2171 [Pseudopedobacter saltans DSM 12145]|uniref:LamG domain-containing protein n=1 Tax=Pseudopedobacter saltans (strain ATCC 51119 / DSM 12145 / JCM 21818 / CCUG 39354 / LMG 10337 / NBRC 100064 / NCIMB 13643) TaxID=762903 RepID=F0SBN2_PSESL|nr:LamG domain-containing protein [Pseudopedobacter saltans]ADY52723.1 hypothetical protein Pedsa_2171 [Pseudopedobacter saltans DSM 12145]
MKKLNINQIKWIFFLAATVLVSACKKSDNPNNLPGVNPADYEGKVDGYDSADQIFPNNLKAYWSFDDTENELKSNTAPTQKLNDTYIQGVKGKALKLSGGYLYYAKQFDAFKTAALKSFTISVWVQIANNGSKKTMLMTIARPGMFLGNLDFRLNTDRTDQLLKVGPRFTAVGGGSQDNLNADKNPTFGANVWTHLLLTYDTNSGTFKMWANGEDIGSYNNRGVGNNLFNSFEPNEFIIGTNYNNIPGKTVSTDASFSTMSGSIDELRIYDRVLPDAHIKALYNLGKAGK